MRWLLPLLLASILTLALSLSSAGAHHRPLTKIPATPSRAVPRVSCERPRTLRLRRFEDRSARLECGGRVLVRVSVPG